VFPPVDLSYEGEYVELYSYTNAVMCTICGWDWGARSENTASLLHKHPHGTSYFLRESLTLA
jgi:hypothetical protein